MDYFCDNCGKQFHEIIDMEQHKRDAHTAARAKKAVDTAKWIVPVLAIAVIVVIVGAVAYVLPGIKMVAGIDNVQCNIAEQSVFHIHMHLDVFVNGTASPVPADIGITGTCLYWLHTHDATGVIHIESPVAGAFTLGQFMNIWNSTQSQLPDGTPVAYVNGAIVANYRNVTLNAHDEIVLVYGTPPAQIPQNYYFEPGL